MVWQLPQVLHDADHLPLQADVVAKATPDEGKVLQKRGKKKAVGPLNPLLPEKEPDPPEVKRPSPRPEPFEGGDPLEDTLRRADALRAQNKVDEAIRHYQKFLTEANPASQAAPKVADPARLTSLLAQGHYQLGSLYLEKGQRAQAEQS